jgi:hypothetical protein
LKKVRHLSDLFVKKQRARLKSSPGIIYNKNIILFREVLLGREIKTGYKNNLLDIKEYISLPSRCWGGTICRVLHEVKKLANRVGRLVL